MSIFLFSFDSFCFSIFEMILFVLCRALFHWSADQEEYVCVFHSILWIVFQDLNCYVFLIRRLHRWFLRRDFLLLTFSMTSVIFTALQLKFVYVMSFLFLGQLCDLAHSKKWLLNLWNFKFNLSKYRKKKTESLYINPTFFFSEAQEITKDYFDRELINANSRFQSI